MATATVIGLVTVTALIGLGGLGQQITYGFNIGYYTPIIVGLVLSVVLAALCDLLLVGLQRLVVPWSRSARRARAALTWRSGTTSGISWPAWRRGSPPPPTGRDSIGHPRARVAPDRAVVGGGGGRLVIGGGIGLVLGHTGRGGLVAVNAANAARAVPSLALLTLFAIVPWISLRWGGFLAAFLALVVLAIPPILTNTYVGMREVDAEVRDAAKAMGLTGGQVLRTVELPAGHPVPHGRGPHRRRSKWWPPPRWPPTSATPTSARRSSPGSTPTTPWRPSPGRSSWRCWPQWWRSGLGVLQRVLTPVPLRRRRRRASGVHSPGRLPDVSRLNLTNSMGLVTLRPTDRRPRLDEPVGLGSRHPPAKEGPHDAAPTFAHDRCRPGHDRPCIGRLQ